MIHSSELQFIIDLARGAGAVVRQRYGKVKRLTKTHGAAHQESVTEADRESQRHIVAGLRQRFPDDGIIGEESDSGDSITFECPHPQGRNWVIDPIDGTNNFIAGYGAFAVCIGLMDGQKPVMGVVYDVMRDEMYAGRVGEGAWLDGHPIHAAMDELNPSSLLMLTANLIRPEKLAPPWAQRWISQTDLKVRMLGSAALEVAAVASGVAYGAVTINGKLWDIAAPAAVALAAGAVVSDLEGNPRFPYPLEGYTGAKVPFLVAAPRAHAPLLAAIREHA